MITAAIGWPLPSEASSRPVERGTSCVQQASRRSFAVCSPLGSQRRLASFPFGPSSKPVSVPRKAHESGPGQGF